MEETKWNLSTDVEAESHRENGSQERVSLSDINLPKENLPCPSWHAGKYRIVLQAREIHGWLHNNTTHLMSERYVSIDTVKGGSILSHN